MKSMIVLSLALSAGGAALAQDAPITYGTAECRIANLLPAPATAVQWSGKCQDGFADGVGILTWKTADGSAMRLQGRLLRGAVAGEAKLRIGDKLTYIGSLRDGIPDGEGYLKYADGLQYEGGLRMMVREGKGTQIYPSGDVYQGQFSKNRPNGQARLSFVLGGSIEGEFVDGKPTTRGKMVYAGSGRTEDLQARAQKEAHPKPAADKTFKTREDEAQLGTHFRRVNGTGSLPSNVGWEMLTEDEKAQFRSQYPALEEGDDPPYPEHGPGGIYKVVRAAGGRYGDNSELHLNVLVGADGVAKQVVKLGDFDAEATRYVAAAAMGEHYKPAKCHGAPCEMMYPLHVRFQLVW